MLKVISGDQLRRIIEERIHPLPAAETVPLAAACGRVLASGLSCPEDVPGFDRSMVDGYAVAAADVFGCSEAAPTRLKLVGEVRMGEDCPFSLRPGEAAYVPTGGQLPSGADAMVMVEHSEELGDGYVYLHQPAAPGRSVVFRGDDIRAGQPLLAAGLRLQPHHIGMLAAAGLTQAPVRPRVRVAIISTGDELVPPQDCPGPGQVRDVNAWFLAAAVREAGAEQLLTGIVRDEYDLLYQASRQALAEADLLLISGGSSVGTRDNTERVIAALPGMELLVHGLAIKPGKPTLLGVGADNKVVFGLPGHPLSAYFIYRLFVTAAIAQLEGAPQRPPLTRTAVLSTNYPSNGGREEYLPVDLTATAEGLLAQPVFAKSGLISLLAQAKGYVRIPREREGLVKGQQVEVELF